MGLPRLQLPDLEDREFGRKGKGTGSKHRGQCPPHPPQTGQDRNGVAAPGKGREGPRKLLPRLRRTRTHGRPGPDAARGVPAGQGSG